MWEGLEYVMILGEKRKKEKMDQRQFCKIVKIPLSRGKLLSQVHICGIHTE